MKNPGQFLQCFAEGVLGQGPEKDGRRSLVYKALVSLQKMKATGPENDAITAHPKPMPLPSNRSWKQVVGCCAGPVLCLQSDLCWFP